MADGAKETPAAVRGRTWHRGGSEWEREARANQDSTARDCGSGAAAPKGEGSSGSGLLQQVRRRCRARMQGTEGALGSGAAQEKV